MNPEVLLLLALVVFTGHFNLRLFRRAVADARDNATPVSFTRVAVGVVLFGAGVSAIAVLMAVRASLALLLAAIAASSYVIVTLLVTLRVMVAARENEEDWPTYWLLLGILNPPAFAIYVLLGLGWGRVRSKNRIPSGSVFSDVEHFLLPAATFATAGTGVWFGAGYGVGLFAAWVTGA